MQAFSSLFLQYLRGAYSLKYLTSYADRRILFAISYRYKLKVKHLLTPVWIWIEYPDLQELDHIARVKPIPLGVGRIARSRQATCFGGDKALLTHSKAKPGNPLPLGRRGCQNTCSALVAQLDRVPGYEPGGRGFESLPARQSR